MATGGEGEPVQAMFWGYAFRGARRAYHGDPDTHLIHPRLLRPMAFVFGAAVLLSGIGALLAGAPARAE